MIFYANLMQYKIWMVIIYELNFMKKKGKLMQPGNIKGITSFLAFIIFISFFLIGGCDIEFGNSDNNGGSSDLEKIEGTIINILPSRSVEGITVEVRDPDRLITFSDVTGPSGFFEVEGNFEGTPEVQFKDETDDSLGLIFVNVFDDARIELGNIRLENGVVILDDPTIITFKGDVIQNDCVDNIGTIIVETLDGDTDVILQISSSTDVLDKDGDSISCQDIFIGQEVETRGILLIGNSLDAFRIQLQ